MSQLMPDLRTSSQVIPPNSGHPPEGVHTELCFCLLGLRPAKVMHQPPQGLLQPLPIPHRPWSHIALDFVTGLPTSNHNTTILTIIDRFSKAFLFIPLTKVPSASETAQLLITHVVRLHGIPTDIVSDRGPQFSTRFWKAFCKLIGANLIKASARIKQLVDKRRVPAPTYQVGQRVWRG